MKSGTHLFNCPTPLGFHTCSELSWPSFRYGSLAEVETRLVMRPIIPNSKRHSKLRGLARTWQRQQRHTLVGLGPVTVSPHPGGSRVQRLLLRKAEGRSQVGRRTEHV